MVNNATNFNKTNISPELAESKTTKKETMTYYVRNRGPGDAQWAEPVSFTCHSVLMKLYTEPSMGASYQILINLATWF
jgi:hypothetical protein